MRSRFIFAIPFAATWIALIPSSGASPAWEERPMIVAKILIWPGPQVKIFPTSPLASNTIASFPLIMDRSIFLTPFIPPSSPMVNKISVLRHGRFCSLITLTASMIAAIPDLSSPERIVDPSVWIIPSSISGLIPLPGVTVSICAHIIVGSPGIVPGRYAHTLNPLDPNPSPALSVFTSRPSAFRSSTNFSPIAFSFFVSLSIIA